MAPSDLLEILTFSIALDCSFYLSSCFISSILALESMGLEADEIKVFLVIPMSSKSEEVPPWIVGNFDLDRYPIAFYIPDCFFSREGV
jgi:hypothetical protein